MSWTIVAIYAPTHGLATDQGIKDRLRKPLDSKIHETLLRTRRPYVRLTPPRPLTPSERLCLRHRRMGLRRRLANGYHARDLNRPPTPCHRRPGHHQAEAGHVKVRVVGVLTAEY